LLIKPVFTVQEIYQVSPSRFSAWACFEAFPDILAINIDDDVQI